MTIGAQSNKVNAIAWIKEKDSQWREDLKPLSLVSEFPLSKRELQQIATIFGSVQRLKIDDLGSQRDFLHRFPAALVLLFTSVAVDVYEGGEFWPGFWRTCEITSSENPLLAKIWGTEFLNALAKLDFPVFEGLPKKYLGPILMHAGIPNYCLSDYFSLLEVSLKRVGVDPIDVLTWVVPRLAQQFPNVDVPVHRFLEKGGAVALDFVDRTIEMMIRLGKKESIDALELPERIKAGARKYFEVERKRLGRGSLAATYHAMPKATIRLIPYASQLLLQLPAIKNVDSTFAWNISTDSESEPPLIPRIQIGGDQSGIQESVWNINRTVRFIQITARYSPFSQGIDLINEKDPILVFNEEGTLLSSRMSLPSEKVWVLYPIFKDVPPPEFEEHQIAAEEPPLGWEGWNLVYLDLANLKSISLGSSFPTHFVRTQSSVKLLTSGVLPNLTSSGLPLFSERPRIELPADLQANWNVVIRDTVSSAVLKDVHYASSLGALTTVDPFHGISSPLLGKYEIQVRGPLGRGFTQHIIMAEGVTYSSDREWRLFSKKGLDTGCYKFHAEGIEINPNVLELAPNEVRASLNLVANDKRLVANFNPNAMAVSIAISDIPSRWSNGPVRIAVEDLPQARLLLRVPTSLTGPRPHLTLFSSSRELIQEISPENAGEKSLTFTYSLAEIFSTAKSAIESSLVLYVGDDPIQIAHLTPREVATSLVIEDNDLVFQDFTGGEVQAIIWSVFEPWSDPLILTIPSDGRVPLPSEVVAKGTLAVNYERFDPWIVPAITWMPTLGTSTIIEHPIDPDSVTDEVKAIFEKSIVPAPLSESQSWALIAMRNSVPKHLISSFTVRNLTQSLRSNPRTALLALEQCPTTNIIKTKLLVQSRILWSSKIDTLELNEENILFAETQLKEFPLAGALIAIPLLMKDIGRHLTQDLWEAVIINFGEIAESLLTGGPDSAVKAGSFQDIGLFATFPVERRDEIIATLQLVPKPLLEEDTRVRAAIALFEERHTSYLSEVGEGGSARLDFFRKHFHGADFSDGVEILTLRKDSNFGNGWQTLSAQSIGFALTARLACRGDERAKDYLDKNVDAWSAISQFAPLMTAVDIVLAECMVSKLAATIYPVRPPILDRGEEEN